MKLAVFVLSLVATASAFAPAARPFGVSVAVRAEPDKDWEAELKKLEIEAEERIDAKAAELEANIEKGGE
eukprot:CAMPEP_0116562512 /NCGR_PEP_ID=MMETSP0397-20121206/12198_1 /TAXON_ID=216820 /ORGANISM="Cyclophora tenuis, Strain ECT3854" /LENGTH=69 /DNA_ID=CAMNT_0004088811 /DNA_START=21 /DNA_END=233 /DNA_ORIENTATION=+